MSNSYTVVIERDIDTGYFIGEVVELPGCYVEAPDLDTLKEYIADAIGAYREAVEDDPLTTFVGTMRVEVPTDALIRA